MRVKLERQFYQKDSVTVAKALLGCVLISDIVKLPSDERTAGIIVETEAYGGEKDPGSHAFKGETVRTKIMYGEPGKAYVYLIYGKHCLLNVVTEKTGTPGAVLIRALQPVKGIETMKRRRATDTLLELTNGPGKLTQALGITVMHNGLDMTEDTVWIEPFLSVDTIHTSSRIGVPDELPLRFFIENEFTSI
ncbi:MAG: DNA-3-methyladenine glycosylase [Theionarchaea archaeon]|nr:DNA-3-methyladenine glycosylase [Theionarchaea archaeon]